MANCLCKNTFNLTVRVLLARAAIPTAKDGQISVAVSVRGRRITVWGASTDCKREVYRPVPAHGGYLVSWPESELKSQANKTLLNSDAKTFVITEPCTAILVF